MFVSFSSSSVMKIYRGLRHVFFNSLIQYALPKKGKKKKITGLAGKLDFRAWPRVTWVSVRVSPSSPIYLQKPDESATLSRKYAGR